MNDELAKKVGFSSGRQLERATYVTKERPDLMEKVDAGEKSVTQAYEEARGIKRKPRRVVPDDLPSTAGIVNGKLCHIGGGDNQAIDFSFVLDEIRSAAKYYLGEIQSAAKHYSRSAQNVENDKAISRALRDTFYAAADMFEDNYIEEEDNDES